MYNLLFIFYFIALSENQKSKYDTFNINIFLFFVSFLIIISLYSK